MAQVAPKPTREQVIGTSVNFCDEYNFFGETRRKEINEALKQNGYTEATKAELLAAKERES